MKLAEFIRWIVEVGPWNGSGIDGGCIQDKAVELGILVEVPFDPAKHDNSVGAEPGEQWFEFSPEFKAYAEIQ